MLNHLGPKRAALWWMTPHPPRAVALTGCVQTGHLGQVSATVVGGIRRIGRGMSRVSLARRSYPAPWVRGGRVLAGGRWCRTEQQVVHLAFSCIGCLTLSSRFLSLANQRQSGPHCTTTGGTVRFQSIAGLSHWVVSDLWSACAGQATHLTLSLLPIRWRKRMAFPRLHAPKGQSHASPTPAPALSLSLRLLPVSRNT